MKRRARNHAAGNRFTQTHNVGHYFRVIAAKHFTGSAEACLHFIEQHQDSSSRANLPHCRQVVVRRDNYATFSLNRLEYYPSGIAVDSCVDGGCVTVRDEGSFEQRKEWLAENIPACDRERTQGFAVKGIDSGDELALASVKTCELEGSFNGLSAG